MAEQPSEVFVAVGSNLEPEKHILGALQHLRRHARLTGVSTVYRTAPRERPDQPFFLNGVWRVETSKPPRELKFDVLRVIEAELGRVRTRDKHAARTIDLDIVLFGNLVVDEDDLRIPDPDIRTRPFLALPILELAPDLVLPDTGERLASIIRVEDGEMLEPMIDFMERLRAEAC